MTLTAALFITLGFSDWCSAMTKRFDYCADATENDIDRADGVNPEGFYMQMFTAQLGAWLSWATWCGLLVFALLKLCRYHQQENIRVSVSKESQWRCTQRALISLANLTSILVLPNPP